MRFVLRRYAAVILIVLSLAVSLASAANPSAPRVGGPGYADPDLNVTGSDIANNSVPSRYEVSPTLIDLKVVISDTPLPGPKGEMAAGPRSIGFSGDPLSLAILVVAIAVIVAGTWYIVKRKPEDDEEEGDEETTE